MVGCWVGGWVGGWAGGWGVAIALESNHDPE